MKLQDDVAPSLNMANVFARIAAKQVFPVLMQIDSRIAVTQPMPSRNARCSHPVLPAQPEPPQAARTSFPARENSIPRRACAIDGSCA